MIFAMGPLPESIGYATSPGPLGPWTYQGVIMANQSGHAFTNHAGVVDFKGHSYFFYHTQELPGGGGFKRSVAVEEFTYNADGAIPSINKTSEGVTESVEPLNPYDRVEAETIAWEEGVETEPCSEGGMNVTDISDGDYIKVEQVEFGAGADTFNYRVASASGGGAIELRLGGANGTLIGTCAVESTGGEDTWDTQSCAVDVNSSQDLFLRFTGGGFKFDWWQFEGPGDPGAGGTGGTGGQGGTAGSGGSEPTGGAVDTGGSGGVTASGGTSATGGEVATGGISNSGGSEAGGTPGTGGISPTGGSTAAGGNSQTGGTTVIDATGGSISTGGAMTATGGTATPTAGSTSGTAAGGLLGTGGGNETGGPQSSGTGGVAASNVDAGPMVTDASSDEGGCGCRVAGGRSNSGLLAALGVLGLLVFGSRRRRGRGRCDEHASAHACSMVQPTGGLRRLREHTRLERTCR
jgi:MYXO-CTERM domain-containing protein